MTGELAPKTWERVPRRLRRTRSVSTTHVNDAWAGDIEPHLDAAALNQFLGLWMLVAETVVGGCGGFSQLGLGKRWALFGSINICSQVHGA